MKAVWEFFNSLKLTVYLILAIVSVTMLGSFVLYLNPRIFGDMDQTLLFRWLASRGLDYPAYTWWLYVMVAMVVLLGVNTLVCTVERLPKLVNRYRDPMLNLRDVEPGGGTGREMELADGPGLRLSGRLKESGYHVFMDGDRLFAEKNRWVPFMPYLVHAGIMVFMVAHLISGLYGYRNSGLYIYQGETARSPGGDYNIRVDEVKIDYRDDGSLKDYGSRLTAIKDGREIKSGWVSANMPMFVEGGAVYQRQFGYGFKGLYVRAAIPSQGFDDYVYLPKGASMVDIGMTGYSLSVDRFLSDAATDERGMYYSISEELANPAIMASVYHKAGKKVASGWLFARDPMKDDFRSTEVMLKLADVDLRPYSSFDVNRDPGAIPAFLASLIVMFGSVVTLYFRRERVWATLDEAAGRAQVICTDEDVYDRLAV
ncbi:MAG TPA: cytochrome c biogenesis protein ResB [Nitrospirota bacterium]